MLGSVYLQCHPLVVPPDSLEGAVRAGNNFLQVKVNLPNSQHIREGTEAKETLGEVHAVKTAEGNMSQLMAVILKLTK